MRRIVNCLSLFLIVMFTAACNFKNDGSLLVLEGDGDRNCSELHIEWEKANQLSKENIEVLNYLKTRGIDEKAIKNFNLEEKSDDFLSYGTASKNLYLIMLEKGVN